MAEGCADGEKAGKFHHKAEKETKVPAPTTMLRPAGLHPHLSRSRNTHLEDISENASTSRKLTYTDP